MEFDDFDEDDEYFSPPPHADDRLWRHPSEIGSGVNFTSAESSSPTDFGSGNLIDGPVSEDPRILARVAARWPLALAFAGGAVVFAMFGMTQIFAVDDPPDVTEVASSTRSSSVSVVPAARGEADWHTTLRDIVETTNPRIEAFHGSQSQQGRGIFISSSGHVLTSAQLVDNADMIVITTSDGSRYVAHGVGVHALSDVAVIKIDDDTGQHQVAPLGLDSMAQVGQPAVTIPMSESGVAVGQITRIASRSTLTNGKNAYGVLNIDIGASSLEPGTAVFDDTGTTIGMIPMVDASNRYSSAVPIEVAHRIASGLVLGNLTDAWIGVEVREATSEGSISGSVVEIADVVDPGPAFDTGIEVGDRITSIAGQNVNSISDLMLELWKHEPGTTIDVGVLRGLEYQVKEIELEVRPPNYELVSNPDGPGQ